MILIVHKCGIYLGVPLRDRDRWNGLLAKIKDLNIDSIEYCNFEKNYWSGSPEAF